MRRGGLWKLPQLWKSAEKRGFPQLLGKAEQERLGFSTVTTGPAAVINKQAQKKRKNGKARGNCRHSGNPTRQDFHCDLESTKRFPQFPPARATGPSTEIIFEEQAVPP